MGVGREIARMADGLGKLLTEHLALAKLELAEDAKVMATQVAKIAAFVPFILVGYALLCAALALWLARWLGAAGGFAVVGGVNVVAGAFGVYRASARLRSHKVLDDTLEEINRSAAVLTAKPEQPLLGQGERPLLTVERR